MRIVAPLRVGHWRVLRTEWTKVATVRSTPWLAAGLVALMIGTGALTVWSLSSSECPVDATGCGDEDLPRLALAGVYLGQVLAVLAGVLVVTPEYATGEIRTTLQVMPRRARVFAAKIAVLLAIVTPGAAAAVLGSIGAARLFLPGRRFDSTTGFAEPTLADGPTLRAAGGTVLYLALLALLAFGVAMAMRSGPGAIAAVFAALFILPSVAALMTDERWREWLLKVSPMTAGLSIQVTRRIDALPIGPWQGLGVVAAETGAALLVAAVLFLRRDA